MKHATKTSWRPKSVFLTKSIYRVIHINAITWSLNLSTPELIESIPKDVHQVQGSVYTKPKQSILRGFTHTEPLCNDKTETIANDLETDEIRSTKGSSFSNDPLYMRL